MNFEEIEKGIGKHINNEELNVDDTQIDLLLKNRVWQRIERKTNRPKTLKRLVLISSVFVCVIVSSVFFIQSELDTKDAQIAVLNESLTTLNDSNSVINDRFHHLQKEVALLRNVKPVIEKVYLTEYKYIEKEATTVEEILDDNWILPETDDAIIEEKLSVDDLENPRAIKFTTTISDSIESLINEGKYDKCTIIYGEVDVINGYTERPWKFTMEFN